MTEVDNFSSIKIGIASPEQIRSWSNGEVKKPETINYRTLKPEKDGLFCEKIFGPTKDWECYCGKYKRVRFKGIICERCGVEVTRSKVRRERMGHIELAAPVAHIWFVKGVPSRMGYLLDISPKNLEKVLYFAANIVISVDTEKRSADALKLQEAHKKYLNELERMYKKNMEQLKAERDEHIVKYTSGEIEIVQVEGKKTITLEDKINSINKNYDGDIADEEEFYKESVERAKEVYDTFMKLKEKDLINDEIIFREMRERFSEYFQGGMGADAIKKLLLKLDCENEADKLRQMIKESSGQKKSRAIKRLKVVSAFVRSDNQPQSMVLEVIPIIPPDLRPMVQLDGGRFATSDLNDLYRRVINRNNRLKRLLDLGAPEIIVNNEKRMLQEAVDALFDNGRRGRAVTGPGNRPLKSLSDMLKGKQGRFRQNLLGKRVDYSGRSVIVVGPKLKLHQCGLPKLMALELFKPFVMKRLVDLGHAQNIKSAKRMVERMKSVVWDVLEEVIEDHPVLLNRAPTLHRLGIQAFMPVLVEGKAIQIHPLVCAAFNADFDGDQMAVHVPLSYEAQAEARILMISQNNLLSPANGRPIMTPSQDMVLGCYYVTTDKDNELGEGRYFSGPDEAVMAYYFKKLALHARIFVKIKGKPNISESKPWTETTVGRLIFNEALPQEFDYINSPVSKKELSNIIMECIEEFPVSVVAETIDKIKEIGFKFCTIAGLTIGIDDIDVPAKKASILAETEKRVDKIEHSFESGLITEDERHQMIVVEWSRATEFVADAMEADFDKFNPIFMMANSGARGNIKQLRQLAGMRGLVANARGDILDRPIKANFREGLSVTEYFLSTHGARQGLADTALRTADSGYLTRRLVDVAQDIIVRIEDCGTDIGITLPVLTVEKEPNPSLVGRICNEDVFHPTTKKVLIAKGEMIENRHLNPLVIADISEMKVRSVLTCEVIHGTCQKCYGKSPATGKLVDIGEAVGIIAAQSIGEPGTQLTMRTFHTGGVASTVILKPIKSPFTGKLIISDSEIPKFSLELSTDKINRMRKENAGEVLTFRIGDIVQIKNPGFLGVDSSMAGRTLKAGEYIEKKKLDEYNRKVDEQNKKFDEQIKEIDEKIASLKIKDADKALIDKQLDLRVKVEKQKKEKAAASQQPIKLKVEIEGGVYKDIDLPKVEEIQLELLENVTAGQVIANIIQTAKRKEHAHKHEKTFEMMDITSGLPRVVELFEARKPKGVALIAETSGTVSVEEDAGKYVVHVLQSDGSTKTYRTIPRSQRLRVVNGQKIEAGEQITDGSKDPHDILKVAGVQAAQQYLVNEVQNVYRSQGVDIHEKHIEIIVRQMFKKVTIVEPGDTQFLPGQLVDRQVFEQENDRVVKEGGEPAKARQILLGITKASLATDSFLSAASFQETTRVLTDAAIENKVDPLLGLKENVIIGKSIPAGTGMPRYTKIDIVVEGKEREEEKILQALTSDENLLTSQ